MEAAPGQEARPTNFLPPCGGVGRAGENRNGLRNPQGGWLSCFLRAEGVGGREKNRNGLRNPQEEEGKNGGGTRIRTGDDGFANRCLSHLAMPPYVPKHKRLA